MVCLTDKGSEALSGTLRDAHGDGVAGSQPKHQRPASSYRTLENIPAGIKGSKRGASGTPGEAASAAELRPTGHTSRQPRGTLQPRA